MQLASISAVPVPTTRTEAAQALMAVPMGAMIGASMTAMTRQMGGQTASRADLVQPMLGQNPLEKLQGAMEAAIEGALALEPTLAGQGEALRAAAKGVLALLAEAQADAVQGDPMEALNRLSTPLQAVSAPLMAAALVLDPTLKDKKPA
jgi:hypothetical protein